MTTCRYDAVTSTRINRMTPVIGSSRVKASSPAWGSSSIRICSGPYATDETASGESAPSATPFDSFSELMSSVISGLPRNTRRATSPTESGMRSLPADSFPVELVTTTILTQGCARELPARRLRSILHRHASRQGGPRRLCETLHGGGDPLVCRRQSDSHVLPSSRAVEIAGSSQNPALRQPADAVVA